MSNSHNKLSKHAKLNLLYSQILFEKQNKINYNSNYKLQKLQKEFKAIMKEFTTV